MTALKKVNIKLTAAPFQQLFAVVVSTPSSFYPGCSGEGVDCGKVELGFSIPPAFAPSVLPHPWMFLVYLCSNAILV